MTDIKETAADANAVFCQADRCLMETPNPSVCLERLSQRPGAETPPFEWLWRQKKTPQSKKHHPEGSVWNHTLLVVDEAAKVRAQSSDPRAFMWAALLHDIGKPDTTQVRSNRITAYDHDRIGAKLAESFLCYFECDDGFVKKVTALVRYHMHLLYVLNDLPFADVPGLRAQADIADVALLCLCDRLGRGGADREREQRDMELFIEKNRWIKANPVT
jgi:putative nucleotidyltransferase with HDIG domain